MSVLAGLFENIILRILTIISQPRLAGWNATVCRLWISHPSRFTFVTNSCTFRGNLDHLGAFPLAKLVQFTSRGADGAHFVNPLLVCYVFAHKEYTVIHFERGHSLDVQEDLSTVVAQLTAAMKD